MDNEKPREGVVNKAPFKKLVLAVEVKDSGKLSQREEEMAQEIKNLKRRLNELEGPVGKLRPELGRVVVPKATPSASGVGSQDMLLKNAKGDVSRVMIPRLNRIYKVRGKLMRSREKLEGLDGEDLLPRIVSP